MPYTAEISRANPSCFLFLIDQSGSMSDPFGGEEAGKVKADEVAAAVNRLLQNLTIKCAKEEGVRDYFDVGVLGYGATVGPAFGGSLAGRTLVPISEVADSPLRIDERQKREDDGAGGIIERSVKFAVWFDPMAQGPTPMCDGFRRTGEALATWVSDHPDSFPPIVFNITDGEPTDGDPTGSAEQVQQLATSDGNVLVFNIHVSSTQSEPIVFPDSEAGLPDDHARLLFRMSSYLPSHIREQAEQEGYPVSEATRGYGFNADLVALITFIDIGTRATNLR